MVQFTPPGKSKAIELTTLASAHHVEMNPSDAGSSDRSVIQEVIKEMAASVPLDSTVPFKVIVLLEVDSLSRGAQHALRRTMEKYGGTCRLILCSSSTGRLLEPVRSRCLSLRVPAPSHEQLAALVERVAARENIQLGEGLSMRLAKDCDRNARRALLALEAMRVRSGPNLAGDLPIPRTDWEEAIDVIARAVLEEQSPARLLQVRVRLYELLGHCIPADVILRRLLEFLLKRVDGSLRPLLIEVAAQYDQRLRQGSKAIFHLEAFVARFMAVYKQFLASMIFD